MDPRLARRPRGRRRRLGTRLAAPRRRTWRLHRRPCKRGGAVIVRQLRPPRARHQCRMCAPYIGHEQSVQMEDRKGEDVYAAAGGEATICTRHRRRPRGPRTPAHLLAAAYREPALPRPTRTLQHATGRERNALLSQRDLTQSRARSNRHTVLLRLVAGQVPVPGWWVRRPTRQLCRGCARIERGAIPRLLACLDCSAHHAHGDQLLACCCAGRVSHPRSAWLDVACHLGACTSFLYLHNAFLSIRRRQEQQNDRVTQ